MTWTGGLCNLYKVICTKPLVQVTDMYVGPLKEAARFFFILLYITHMVCRLEAFSLVDLQYVPLRRILIG
jgi:hypothetical protein